MIRCKECKTKDEIQAVFLCHQYGFAEVNSLDFNKDKANIDWVDNYDSSLERFECGGCGEESTCLADIAEEVSKDDKEGL